MAINKKLIYYNRTLANFKSDANGLNGQTTASGGNVGNIPYASIVFTSDGYIWTHGKEFNCNNTWRGILNNLTSTSTTDSLSAYQGKILNEKIANYLPLSGGTLTGALSVPSLTVTGASTFSQAINGSILGNAATASRLLNARTISLSGSVTGSGTFDGSGNLTIATTTNHNFDGRYLRWGGSSADVTAMGWGTLTTANGYTILSHATSSDGGDWGMVNKGGQIFMLLDGYYYQREGQYRVIDTSEITSYGSRNNGANKIVTTDSNGYLYTGWVNTTSGPTTSTIDRIYASNDGFIRYVTPATFRTQVIEPYYVNLTGTQTISGNKTFSSSVSIDDLTAGNLVVTGGASFALTINGTIDKALKDGSGNTIASTYVKKSGDTMSGLLTVTTGSNHAGIKAGDTYINSIGGELILQNNTAIRFGGDSWDWNVWAGLKYVHSSKIIYLGLADNSAFTANSALSGGKLYTPGISNIYIGNGTLTVYHTGNLSIGTLMGSTAIGDADEPVYWSGTAFVKAGAYPTKSSWNYDDVYLKLSGGVLSGSAGLNAMFVVASTNTVGPSITLRANTTVKSHWGYYPTGTYTYLSNEVAKAELRIYDNGDFKFTTNYGNSSNLYTVYHTGNLSPMTTSHAANGITSTNITNWNSVYTWYTTAAGTSASGVIDNWNEIKNFIDGFHESDDLAEYLVNTFVAKTGGTMTGALTTPSLTVTGASTFSLAINGSILGNAATASRLQTARTISLTGSVTGSGSFDGSGNLSIATTTNHSHSYVNTIGISGSKLTWSINGTAQTAIQLPTYTNNITSHLRAGAQNGTANSTSATSDPYLLLVEGSTLDSLIQLKASTGISISANGGVITITNTSPDVNHNTHTYTSTWTSVTGNNAYPIAISPNATPATSGNGYNANFTFNPSTKTFNNNGSKQVYDSTNKVLKFIFD